MYAASDKNIQQGGEYVSTVPDLSTPNISASTLSSIIGLQSFDQLASLSIEQISNLIDSVTSQLARENTNLVTAQTQITSIQADIDRTPGGYQELYDTANQNYISALNAYNSADAKLKFDQSTLSSLNLELEGLYDLSTIYTSNLVQYELEYSTIWSSIQHDNSTIASENQIYQTNLRNYLDYSTKYTTAMYNLESTQRALQLNSSMLSTAMYSYQSTSSVYSRLLGDYEHFSTNDFADAEYKFISTNKYLSSLLGQESTLRGIYMSTSTAYHIANLNVNSAEAVADYRNALQVEQSTIIRYNAVENEIDALISVTGPRDISYYASYVPPANNQAAYQTLYIMLSTLSIAMFSTAKVRSELEINQSTIYENNLRELLDTLDSNISSAKHDYILAGENRDRVISTMSGLSTRIGLADTAEAEYLSRYSALSTAYITEMSTYNGINANIAAYTQRESTLSSYLRSTMLTLQMLEGQSTIYNSTIDGYMLAYYSWSTLEGVAQSTIDGYKAIKAQMEASISALDSQISVLGERLGADFITLKTNATTYYTNVSYDNNNDLDSYKYGLQEWNSFIGYICSELLIQKLMLYTQIDSINFALKENISSTEQASLSQEKASLTSTQGRIQNVIDVLNNLDLQFSTLLQLVETERADKAAFVATRTTLTNYEIAVLQDATQFLVVKGNYTNEMGILNTRNLNINSDIINRNNKLSALMGIITPQLAVINGLNLISYVLPDPLNANIGPFNLDPTEYALLPQINYGLNPSLYPLVFTSAIPSNVTGSLPSQFYQ